MDPTACHGLSAAQSLAAATSTVGAKAIAAAAATSTAAAAAAERQQAQPQGRPMPAPDSVWLEIVEFEQYQYPIVLAWAFQYSQIARAQPS